MPAVALDQSSPTDHRETATHAWKCNASSECLNCDEAVRLAAEVAARYPDVLVRVIDLDLDGSPPPEPVVAVPTHVLNGRVVSLGNPYLEELFARLRLEFGPRPNSCQTDLA